MFLFKGTFDDSNLEVFLVNSNPTYLCSVLTQCVVTLGRISPNDLILSVSIVSISNSFPYDTLLGKLEIIGRSPLKKYGGRYNSILNSFTLLSGLLPAVITLPSGSNI